MKTIPVVILVLGVSFVLVVWILVVGGVMPWLKTEQLEPLFTGLAFVGLLATFWHERANAAEAEREHIASLKESRRLVAAQLHSARVTAMIAHVDYFDRKIARATEGRPDQRFFEYVTKRDDLMAKLVEIIDAAPEN